MCEMVCLLRQAIQAHGEVEAQVTMARLALGELAGCVRELAAARGAVGPLLDTMQRAIARLTQHRYGSATHTHSHP